MAVNPEELLSHAGFVRALARKLVPDEHWSADVTQQTLLAALENPPDPCKPLRGWLSKVAYNLSIKLRLSESRRRKREQASARRKTAPSTDEIIEREEVRRRVVETVLGLEEPYRSTLILRFYEDLPPRVVAKNQGVPPETVKTRLKRGIEQMRKRLDDCYGGAGKKWRLALLPVAGWPLATSAKASAGVPSLLYGVFLMASKVKTGIAAVAVLGILLGVWQVARWAVEIEPDPELPPEMMSSSLVEKEPVPEPEEPKDPPEAAPPAPEREETLKDNHIKIIKPPERPAIFPKSHYIREDVLHGMVLVPGGRVWIGMSSEDVLKLSQKNLDIMNNLSHSIPKHRVRVNSFYCDIFEVTNAQWKLYLETIGREPSEDLVNFAWKKATTYPKEEADFPIRNVSLQEARRFAQWCGKRLPTEYEWKRAAAGDKDVTYPWGNDWREKLCTNGTKSLSPVGSYEEGKSTFGIHDMSGSVWEWTESPFQAFKGFKPPRIQIHNRTKAATTRFSGSSYVMKGGDYQGSFLACRLDIRDGWLPNTNTTTLGFRCVKDEWPGETVLNYAVKDLEGSVITMKDFDLTDLYALERTEYTFDERPLIRGFDYFLLCPFSKELTTTAKIRADSVEEPFPFGILSSSRPLAEPDLPPGSYVLAYRYVPSDGKYREEKRKREEEAKKKTRGKNKEEEALRLKAEDERKREEEKARKEMEKLGLVPTTRQHIDFPRDRGLILFMNADDAIVGYVETGEMQEVSVLKPICVEHNPPAGTFVIDMELEVLGGRNPRFIFQIKIEDSPF